MARTTLQKYETDAGTIVRIRMSDNTVTANDGLFPAGAIDDANVFAYASNPGSRRKKQLNARGVVLVRSTGTGINTKVFRTFLPLATKASLDGQNIGDEISIGTVVYTVFAKIPEA